MPTLYFCGLKLRFLLKFTFDPSIILLQVLLRMDTTASVAIVFDSVWRADLSHVRYLHFVDIIYANQLAATNVPSRTRCVDESYIEA